MMNVEQAIAAEMRNRRIGEAIKSGARHSALDQGHIQVAHDRLVAAGAQCGTAKAWTRASAVKSVGGGRVEGLLVRYTNPNEFDVEQDYFTPQTNLGVKDGQELPLLFHHGRDKDVGSRPIGRGIVKFTDAGLWFQSWLDRRDQYEQFILKMIELGKCGYSGGAPYIVRAPTAGKARRVVTFPLVEGSVTPTPADPGNRVSLKAMMQSPRAARIERELKALEFDVADTIDMQLYDLEWQMRLEKELAQLERGY